MAVPASKYKGLLVLSIVLGFFCLGLVCVSLGTNSWVVGNGFSVSKNATVGLFNMDSNFGLYRGTQNNCFNAKDCQSFTITLTCDVGENACMMSCGTDSSKRQKDLQSFLTGNGSQVEDGDICGSNASPSARRRRSVRSQGEDGTEELKAVKADVSSSEDSAAKDQLMVFGAWLMTVVFVVIGLSLSVVSAVLGVFNLVTTPISSWAGLPGLKMYHGLASASLLLAICIWAGLFGSRISHTFPIRLSLKGQYNFAHGTTLGYSYWLVLVAMLLHAGSAFCLVLRDYLWERSIRKTDKIMEQSPTNGAIMLY